MLTKIVYSGVKATSTTGFNFSAAELGGAGIQDNPGNYVYIWCDSVVRVSAPGRSAAQGCSIGASKLTHIGNAPNATTLLISSVSANPDVRYLIADGPMTGI
jgi:hypothetical protein